LLQVRALPPEPVWQDLRHEVPRPRAEAARPGRPGGELGVRPEWVIVLRGYDRKQVDEYLDELESATTRPAELPRFRIAFRGYERRMVDAYVRQLFDALPAPSD